MKLPIYLDYSATTPVDPRVAAKMVECLTTEGNFGNPASRSHLFGWKAEEAVENARRQVAELVNADPREIVWTSGATESDNLAIKGVAHFYASKGKHIVTTKIEHKAVLDTTRQLEREGFEVTYIEPGEDGIITPAMVEAALRDDTVLVSVMHVNNEIGTINDITAIGELTRSRGILFHVDAAQSTGKVEIDLEKMKVDLMSFSAHKTYGPKGLALCMCVASRVFASRRRCTAVAMSAACVRVPWRPTSWSAWARPFASPRRRWHRRTSGSAACAIGSCARLRHWKSSTSTAA